MAQERMMIKVRVAWWLRPYLHALAWFCSLHECEPDPEKLQRVVRRALRVSAAP
jgi:hypothetical protein